MFYAVVLQTLKSPLTQLILCAILDGVFVCVVNSNSELLIPQLKFLLRKVIFKGSSLMHIFRFTLEISMTKYYEDLKDRMFFPVKCFASISLA